MTQQEVVLLVLDAEMVRDVEYFARECAASGDVAITIEAAQGVGAATAVARVRETYARYALGVIATSDADALEAITSGADEALCFSALNAREVQLLVDRACARASHRFAHASEQNQAAHAEKLAALGTIVAGVAHEINNPLAAVMLEVGTLALNAKPLVEAFEDLHRRVEARRSLTTEDLSRLVRHARNGSPSSNDILDGLAEVDTQLQSIKQIVKDLRIYARTDENEAPELIDVPSLVDRVLRIVAPQIKQHRHAHAERDYATDLPQLVLPPSRMVQVLTNIMINAAHAIGEIERPVHRVRMTIRKDDDFVAISIADTGPGIAPNVLARIFDPFFTTKKAGKGTGLGLSISQSLTRQVGGDLLVESVHGEGATFIVLLPIPDEATLERVRTRRRESTRSVVGEGRRTVLVVEDDDRLLRAYPRALHELYDVIVASNGQEAIDLLVSGSHADVVLTDMAMPEVDGRQLFEWFVANRPDLARKTIFVTAGAQDEASRLFLEETTNVVLEKPVARAQLLAAVASIK